MFPYPFQGLRILLIADHRHDAGIDLLGFNRVDDRLKI
jgi:hypothetical protein